RVFSEGHVFGRNEPAPGIHGLRVPNLEVVVRLGSVTEHMERQAPEVSRPHLAPERLQYLRAAALPGARRGTFRLVRDQPFKLSLESQSLLLCLSSPRGATLRRLAASLAAPKSHFRGAQKRPAKPSWSTKGSSSSGNQ